MDVLICPLCKERYKSAPIVLPCGWTICEIHLQNFDFNNCPSCKSTHPAQANSKFPVNKSVEIQLKLIELVENFSRTKERFDNFKLAYNDPGVFVDDFFNQLVEKVNKRRGEVVESVNRYFESMIVKINEAKAKYKPSEDGVTSITQQNAKMERLKRLRKVNVKKVEDELSGFNGTIQAHKQMKTVDPQMETSILETNQRLSEIELMLDNHLKGFFDENAYQLTPKSNHLSYERIFGELVSNTLPPPSKERSDRGRPDSKLTRSDTAVSTKPLRLDPIMLTTRTNLRVDQTKVLKFMEAGAASFDRKDYKGYLKSKKDLLDLYENLNAGDNMELANRLKHVGIAHYWNNEYKEELEYKLKALEMYERLRLNDHKDVASCLKTVARGFSSNNDYVKHLSYAKRSLEMFERLHVGDNKEVATCLKELGIAYGWNREFKKELDYKIKAMEMYGRLNMYETKQMASALKEVGVAYGRNGDNPKSLEHLQKAVELYERLNMGDDRLVAACYKEMGVSYGKSNDHGKELEYLIRANEMYERLNIGVNREYALCLRDLGSAYNSNGDVKKELEYKLKAVDMFDRLDMSRTREMAKLLRSLANSSLRNNDIKRAIYFGKKSVEAYTSLSGGADNRDLAFAMKDLSLIYSKNNDMSNSSKYSSKAINMLKRIDNKASSSTIMAE